MVLASTRAREPRLTVYKVSKREAAAPSRKCSRKDWYASFGKFPRSSEKDPMIRNGIASVRPFRMDCAEIEFLNRDILLLVDFMI